MEAQTEAVPAAPVAVEKPKSDWWTEMSWGNKACCVFIALFAFVVFCVKTAPPEKQESVHYFRNGSHAQDVEYTAN